MATLQGFVSTALFARSLGVAVLAAALVACGGGGSSSGSPGVVLSDQSPTGIWRGTVSGGVSGDLMCIIAETQAASCTVTYAGGASTAVLSGFASVMLTRIFLAGDAFGLGAGGFNLAGTVLKRDSLSLTGSIGTQAGLTVSATYDGLYDAGSSPVFVQGVYSNVAWNGSPASFSIDANGILFLQAASGCVWNGDVSYVDQRYNAYRVALTLAGCGASDGSYLGLATFTSATSTLRIVAANPTSAVVLSASR